MSEQQANATVKLTNRYGLHMRPAQQVMKLANSFISEITLIANDIDVDAKSILSMISLEATCGDDVMVEAQGADAEEAVVAIAELLKALPELHGEAEDA